MSELPGRNFSGPDSKVYEQAERVALNIPAYRGALQARYRNTMTDAYFDAIFKAIDVGRSLPSDIAMRGVQAKYTADLEPLFKRFDVIFQDIELSAVSAFPDEPAVQSEFGINRKSEIVETPATLHVYLSDFPHSWSRYGARMLAADCPDSIPADIAVLEKDLTACKSLQGAAKVDRHGMAFDRAANVNGLWAALLKLESHTEKLFGRGSKEALLFHLERVGGGKGGEGVVPPPAPKPATPETA